MATYFHYDGWDLLQEGSNAWGPARVYVHGNRADEIIWSYNTFTGDQAFHHYDARGHCTLLTDSLANILEQYEYDAFGQPYFYDASGGATLVNGQPGSPFGNRFLFTGREWLSDLHLYDYRNRIYQSELGRFLQPDPKEFAAGDYNLYRYCHNDPVNRSDPFGLLEFRGTAELQKLTPVLGSNIPQWLTAATLPINFTTSGNFSDANAMNHVVAAGSLGGLKGRTDTGVAVKQEGKALNANLKIDYWIIAARYNELERQHTFGAEGSKTKGLLEKGGYWERMQERWSGGIFDFFARGRLEADLRDYLGRARAEQSGTWDQKWGDHNVPW